MPGSMVLMSRLAKQFYRRSDEQLLGMHLRHLVALAYVRDHDGCPQQDLADALCMDANNVVLLLNELEELGYVDAARDPSDRRRHLVQLTSAGLEALTQSERAQERDRGRGTDRRSTPPSARRCGILPAHALRSAEPVEDEAAYSATIASIST